jgi:hypothetical protein
VESDNGKERKWKKTEKRHFVAEKSNLNRTSERREEVAIKHNSPATKFDLFTASH